LGDGTPGPNGRRLTCSTQSDRRPARAGIRWLAAAIGGGLVFSALTNTCGMAALLAKLPHNRRGNAAFDLNATLAVLRG
jgi:hypothetical protein